jgi:hypothetical protein
MYTQDQLYLHHVSSTPDLSSFTRKFLFVVFFKSFIKKANFLKKENAEWNLECKFYLFKMQFKIKFSKN